MSRSLQGDTPLFFCQRHSWWRQKGLVFMSQESQHSTQRGLNPPTDLSYAPWQLCKSWLLTLFPSTECVKDFSRKELHHSRSSSSPGPKSAKCRALSSPFGHSISQLFQYQQLMDKERDKAGCEGQPLCKVSRTHNGSAKKYPSQSTFIILTLTLILILSYLYFYSVSLTFFFYYF